MIKGDIFERNTRADNDCGYRVERRLILDVTETCVFYQVVYDQPEGTCVEHDYIPDQQQASMKEWRDWAKLARKSNGNQRLDENLSCTCGSKEAGLIWMPKENRYQCGTCIHKAYAILARLPKMFDAMQKTLDRMTTGNLTHHKANLAGGIQMAQLEIDKLGEGKK